MKVIAPRVHDPMGIFMIDPDMSIRGSGTAMGRSRDAGMTSPAQDDGS
jgi:hypothetical protein